MNRDQYNVKREQHQHVVVAAMQAVTLAQRGRKDEHWPHGAVADDDRMEAITQSLRRSEMGN